MSELSLISGSVSKYATPETELAVTKAGDYLPYLGLFGGESKLAKEGKIPIGHFGVCPNSDTVIDLGNEFICIALSWRPKAIDFDGKTSGLPADQCPVAAFDPNSTLFQTIQRHPKGGYGPELLLWLPDNELFVTYHLMNPTGRRESPNFMVDLKKKGFGKLKVRSELIKTTQYTWHGPKASPYDLEVIPPEDNEANQLILSKFNNPPSATTEVKDAEESERE